VRLIAAELLAMRKRAATYVVLGVLLAVMALIFILAGLTGGGDDGPGLAQVLTFPNAYSLLGQFVFGLGSLMAVAYAAAIAGGDWNWGIPRLVISRGESRIAYVLAKAAALAIVLAIGVVIAYVVGIVLVFAAAALSGTSAGNPVGGGSLEQLVESFALGYPVLLERAAIAFAVAILLRSQLAGIVIGIVLYIGEGIAAAILFAVSFGARFGSGSGFEPVGPEWYQYLPFSVGDSVLAEIGPEQLPGGGGGFEDLLLRPVPFEVAVASVAVYGIVAIAIAVYAVWRAEIAA
jgi:ABC-type transport system involved in multi-copper enzyme maturation permease subunit